jgi:DNA end-binding protein Ku
LASSTILADEELREVAPERSTGIEIQEFVNEAEISSLYFEKPYYLEPDKGAGKAFALLREALMKTGKVGIAQFVLRNRDSLCMLRPYGQGLVLNALRFASESDPWRNSLFLRVKRFHRVRYLLPSN